MKIFFIWDRCGESEPELYVATGDAAERAIKCAGQYINALSLPEDDEISLFHEDYICDSEGVPRDPSPEFGKIDPKNGPHGPFDQIVIAGFLP